MSHVMQKCVRDISRSHFVLLSTRKFVAIGITLHLNSTVFSSKFSSHTYEKEDTKEKHKKVKN